jgi:glyceraldehyde 3-phosphate dehydrogenase
VEVTGDDLLIDGKKVKVFKETDPAAIKWSDLGVDIVIESTGLFTIKEDGVNKKGKTVRGAVNHITAGGAKKVIISAPAEGEDLTVVLGVNEDKYDPKKHHVVSNASCTTNCLAPAAKVVHDLYTIKRAFMTTIHSYTNDQVLTDVYHEDLRRARSATMSMIPTKTGAASAVGLVLPELNGKLDGYAIRVPTINVSVVDLCFVSARPTTVEEVNAIVKAAAEGELKGILGYNVDPLVSVDFNHNPLSSVFDATLTKVSGSLVKASAWYDNEWGFSNRMLDTTVALMAAR